MQRFLALLTLAVLMAPLSQARAEQGLAKTVVATFAEIRKTGEFNGLDVDVEIDEKSAAVWLRGQVDSPRQQARILDIARRVPGVKKVINDLKVSSSGQPMRIAEPSQPNPAWPSYTSYPSPSQAAPEVVAKRIEKAIHHLHELGKFDGEISSELYGGIVLLTGQVASADSRPSLLACVRAQSEVDYICDALETVEPGTELQHSVTSKIGTIDQLSVPDGASWSSAQHPGPRAELNWSDGYWQLDFNKVKN